MAESISVKLPSRLKEDIDELIEMGVFVSRSDALKFGARLVVMIERMELPLSIRAEEYATEEIKKKFKRSKNVH